eukprot:CCRYP_021101-RA/>CCRYP_021101-RA protein AED:0.31 eAED:0.31 QI:169/1/1/1/0/0/2/54/500
MPSNTKASNLLFHMGRFAERARRRRHIPNAKVHLHLSILIMLSFMSLYVNVNRTVLRIGLVLFFSTSVASSGAGNSNDERGADQYMYSSVDIYADEDDGYGYKNETIEDKWEADDPFFYYPQDDEVLQRLNAEVEEMRATITTTEANSRLEPVALGLEFFLSVTGVVTSIFYISVALYYLKLDYLMRQYANKGIITEARILVSEPPMNTAIEKDEAEDKRGLMHVEGSNGSDENSYTATTLTEDDDTVSYHRMIDNSKGGSEETENSEESPEDHRHTNIYKQGNSQKKNERKNEHESGQTRIRSLLRLSKTIKSDGLVSAEKFQIRRKHAAMRHIRCNQKFRSVVEYHNLTDLDGLTIRKHLTVTGEDVIVADAHKSVPEQFELKLVVLPTHPMSGLPCGEVQRARRCYRCIVFLPCALFGLALVAVAVCAMYFIAPTFLFVAYIAVLVVNIPILNCFLGPSFDKLISKSYLEKGVRVSSEQATETNLEKVPSESSLSTV